jgi:hypothetical protein
MYFIYACLSGRKENESFEETSNRIKQRKMLSDFGIVACFLGRFSIR